MPKLIRHQLQIKHANSFGKRLKGLLFYKEPITKEGLLIAPCNSVHMFFMRFPIDVVFLDQKNAVVKAIPNLKPWKMVAPVNGAYSALELPLGTIARNDIGEGDTIIL
ncbi:hypothetical protein CFK37_06455 [Virgibacillus phasianinus]|uniref:DUF192 domain-containing protein n=1 Tax=Virgibacillus phasianinus TaxID=2017483 RepID=A0A220U228_9BACI|nr:DUF192 domain-containing protein [Virgibacillus phasianinus]ASK61823.1 hypothetical protein CFK37_06455 [Virgibacillus phasianinus]